MESYNKVQKKKAETIFRWQRIKNEVLIDLRLQTLLRWAHKRNGLLRAGQSWLYYYLRRARKRSWWLITMTTINVLSKEEMFEAKEHMESLKATIAVLQSAKKLAGHESRGRGGRLRGNVLMLINCWVGYRQGQRTRSSGTSLLAWLGSACFRKGSPLGSGRQTNGLCDRGKAVYSHSKWETMRLHPLVEKWQPKWLRVQNDVVYKLMKMVARQKGERRLQKVATENLRTLWRKSCHTCYSPSCRRTRKAWLQSC